MLTGIQTIKAIEVSFRTEGSIRNFTKDHVWHTAAKSLFTFCSCPKTLCEAEFKDGELIDLVEEILGQTKIQAVSWILLDAVTQIYSENS